jgi:hypothetical protein
MTFVPPLISKEKAMKLLICLICLLVIIAFGSPSTVNGQSVTLVQAIPLNPEKTDWSVQVAFSPDPTEINIRRIFIVNVDDGTIIELDNRVTLTTGVYGYTPRDRFAVAGTGDDAKLAKHYELKALIDKNGKLISTGAPVDLLLENLETATEVRQKVKTIDEADIYIGGEINGARKRRAAFSAEIKAQKFNPLGSWAYTPFFKLNASTDPDADPDQMEMGLNLRYISSRTRTYFDNEVKIESERDFENTNLIENPRLTFLPTSYPRALRERKNGKIVLHKSLLFLNPFIGGEFGKNLRSPLKAAEGDGIARLVAGVDVRWVFFLKHNEKAPDLNWTTTYQRRWLLTDELGFKADENGDLQLRTFGTSPRDYVRSKVSYRITKFFDVFSAYEWGQVPPSFKLINHRFRVGFAYKFRFGVE